LAPPTTKTYDVQTTTGGSFQSLSFPFFTQRIDPNVGVILVEASEVHSLYNAAVLTLRKPASHGLEFLANYTYSSSTDDGQQGQNIGGYMFFSSDGVLNPYNFKLEQGPSATDTPNRLVVSAVWAPTYGAKLTSKVERGFLDGWNASATVTDESGSRYSAIVQSSAVQCLTSGNTGTGCLGAPGLDGGFTGTILNSNAAPSGGRAAFQGRDSQVLPSIQNVDFRLTKQFNIRERLRLEFRGEAFNLFNKTLITTVNTTGYTFANPGSSTCPSATHTNECVVPVAGYQTPTQTSANLLGARQLQFGFRFSF